MRNLLKTDFFKLKRSKGFWICAALCVLFGIMMVVAIQSDIRMEMRSENPNDREYMQALEMSKHTSAVWALEQFLPTNFNALIVGIFIAVFITSEFSYGTIKNTLSRGADRTKVFCSKFFVCGVAAVIMQILFIASMLTAGSIVWGYDPNGLSTPGGLISVILTQILVIIGFAALFSFISTTIRANGGAIALNILCATVISTLFSALGMILGIKVPINDYWIGGVVSKLASVAPVSGDVLHGVLVVLAWGVASMIAGTALFRKMDVK